MKSRIYFRGRANRLSGQFIRYVIVGGVAFVVDFLLLYLIVENSGLNYIFSASIAFMAGIAVNYMLSVVWVFNYRRISNRVHEFALFFIIGILGLVFNAALMWFFTERIGLHYMRSKAVAAAIIFLFNFGVRKALLFSRGSGGEKSILKKFNV